MVLGTPATIVITNYSQLVTFAGVGHQILLCPMFYQASTTTVISQKFFEQSKRGFQAKNGKKMVPVQNSTESRKVFRSNNTKVVHGTATSTTATAGGVERRAGWGAALRDLFIYHIAPNTVLYRLQYTPLIVRIHLQYAF